MVGKCSIYFAGIFGKTMNESAFTRKLAENKNETIRPSPMSLLRKWKAMKCAISPIVQSFRATLGAWYSRQPVLYNRYDQVYWSMGASLSDSLITTLTYMYVDNRNTDTAAWLWLLVACRQPNNPASIFSPQPSTLLPLEIITIRVAILLLFALLF